jgi:hypothetical protein
MFPGGRHKLISADVIRQLRSIGRLRGPEHGELE